MSDLVEFLEARLAEDEAVAREAITPDRPGTHWEWESTADDDDPESPRWLRTVEEFPTKSGVGDLPGFPLYGCTADPSPAMNHIARQDPARILREVAAKRAVMIAADDATSYDMTVESDRGVGSRNMIEDPYVGDVILRALASAYSDHPDFNPDWAE